MDAEIERNEFGDCQVMVRDITSAVLPTHSELVARAQRERGGEAVSLTWKDAQKTRSDVGEISEIAEGEELAEGASASRSDLSWKSAVSTQHGGSRNLSELPLTGKAADQSRDTAQRKGASSDSDTSSDGGSTSGRAAHAATAVARGRVCCTVAECSFIEEGYVGSVGQCR